MHDELPLFYYASPILPNGYRQAALNALKKNWARAILPSGEQKEGWGKQIRTKRNEYPFLPYFVGIQLPDFPKEGKRAQLHGYALEERLKQMAEDDSPGIPIVVWRYNPLRANPQLLQREYPLLRSECGGELVSNCHQPFVRIRG